MAKIKLTLNDAEIKRLKPAPKGKRYDAWDIAVPGFSVRVTDTGSKSFSLTAKLATEANTRRFDIGKVADIGLVKARETARKWLELIADKKDPRTVEHAETKALIEEVADDDRHRFGSILSDYSAIRKRHVKEGSLKQKTYEQMRHDFDAHISPIWEARDIRTITAFEIGEVIRKIANAGGCPGSARTTLSHTKTFFGWAAGNGYTVGSAAALLTAKVLIGPQRRRKRVLSREELKAVWEAARSIGGVRGASYMMLILTGCRLREVTEAHWSEIGDLRGKLWTIPGERMKKGKAHAIPLTDMMVEVLNSVPHKSGYIFSLSGGKAPFDCGSREKRALDKLVGFTNWVNHDLRRTMRTMCSPLGIRHHIAEEMIAHAQPGVVGTYDLHEYLDEKREGFRLWNAEVARIVGWKRKLKLVA